MDERREPSDAVHAQGRGSVGRATDAADAPVNGGPAERVLEPSPGAHPLRRDGARPGTGERDQINPREVEVFDGRDVRLPAVLVGSAAWSWRILVILAAVGVLGLLVSHLLLLMVPLSVALLSAALLLPVASLLRRHGWSRGLSTLATVVLAVVVIGGVGFFVVNRAIAGYPQLASETSRAVTNVQNALTKSPFNLPRSSVDNVGDTITNDLKTHQGAITSGVITAGKTAIDVLTGVVLWLFLTIFLIYDGDRVWDWIAQLFPRRGEELVRGAGHRMWHTLSGYVTGQFYVALFHSAVIAATLLILRAPLVAPLVLVVFIFSFVPIIGALVAGGFAAVVVLVADGPVQAVILVIVLIVEDQIESHVLQPLVVGKAVRLHPIAIAATLTAGAVLGGLPGAIFGVPFVATINAAVKFLSGREDIDGNTVARADRNDDPPDEVQPPGVHGYDHDRHDAANAPIKDPESA
jgi:predicted PurR-regulated permease PerM